MTVFLSGADAAQIVIFFVLLFTMAAPLGLYMAHVYAGEPTILSPILKPVENLLYRLGGVDPQKEMNSRQYVMAVIALLLAGIATLYTLLRFQHAPSPLSADLAINTAVSFATNTNWQAYAGETAMSFWSQMAGLTVQNFVSAAMGLAVLVAIIRGFTRAKSETLGNFWVDVTRSVLYVLLPLSLLLALALVSQGVVQTLKPNVAAKAIDAPTQIIALGPVASQVAIKQIGGNGGGFFNANAAHPFENPTPFSHFLEMLAILLIPVAQCFMFGHMARDKRQGVALLAAMTLIFVPMMLFGMVQEKAGNPLLKPLGIEQGGGNMEGKETRFGVASSVLWASAATAAAHGATSSALDSFTPLGGLVPMALMQFGEVIYGGVGTGLAGMLIFVIIAVFIAGLMVGRTPEYLGKKIDVFEMKMASIAVLGPHVLILLGTALAVMVPAAVKATGNPSAQGFSEILYAFTSAAMNNGSAFGGLNADTPFYNLALALAMLAGRLVIIIPILALAGSAAQKAVLPPSAGTLPTHTPLFVVTLACVVVTIGVLTFVPALALGPIAEHFMLAGGV